MFRAIGRSALIVVAGLCLGVLAPAHAVENDSASEQAQAESDAGAPVVLKKYTKRSKYSRRAQSRKVARAERKSGSRAKKVADVEADAKLPAGAEGQAKPDIVAAADPAAATIPPVLANANAQWLSSPQSAADLAARGMTAQADSALRNAQADAGGSQASPPAADSAAGVVASDQLNDVDRAVAEPTMPVKKNATMAMAMQQDTPSTPSAPAQPATVASGDDSAWNQTSLIGKIFIAFGGLLTMASAARMFMA